MNAGQEMFKKFFMGLIQEGKDQEAEKLLQECFKMQDEGKFNAITMATVMPKLFAIVRPECIDTLKEAAANFSQKMD